MRHLRQPRRSSVVFALVVLALLLLPLGMLLSRAGAQAANQSATIAGLSYQPATLTVPLGGTVTWSNGDPFPHTVTAPDGPNSGLIPPGASFSHTFTSPGTFNVLCVIHPEMRGVITVERDPNEERNQVLLPLLRRGSSSAAATPSPTATPPPAAPLPAPTVPLGERWSDPASWPNRTLPAAGAFVQIPAGRTMLLDISPPPLRALQIDGALIFDERDLRLAAGWIMVHGRLQVGTEAAPFTPRAEIVLTGAESSENVMGMGTKLLGAMGGTIDLHGTPRSSWTKLAATVEPGATTIRVLDATGWRIGDRLVVGPTDFDPLEAEERTITAIDGTTLTLNAPLRFRHWGEIQTLGTTGASIDQRAPVGMLSRNVTIRGENQRGSSFGGHLMFMAGSTTRFSQIEVTGMGQLGRLGRYPIHWHLVNDGGRGSYLRGSSVHSNFQRAVVVHRTNDLQIADNVIYNTVGHMVFLESSTEQRNSFERNLVMLTRPVPAAAMNPEIAFEHLPDFRNEYSRVSGFWISNQHNRFVGNQVAAILHGHGYWFVENAALYAGRDGDLWDYRPGGAKGDSRPYQGPLLFEDNVAHSIRPGAEYGGSNPMRVAGNGVMLDAVNFRDGEVVLRNFRAWKISMYAVWGLPGNEQAPAIDGMITADSKSAIFNGEHNGVLAVRNSVFYGMTNNQPPGMSPTTRNWYELWVSFEQFPDDRTVEPVSTYPDNLGVPTTDGPVPETPMLAPGRVTRSPVFTQFRNVVYGGWPR